MSAPVARLPEGVYLGLSTDVYFAQEALGSSDYTTMDLHREGWYWTSRHNRDRVAVGKKVALTYGSALHCIMLEGLEAYEGTYAVAPDKREYPDLVETIDEMREALEKDGWSVPSKGKFDKAGWAAEMAQKMPDRPCWHNLMADFDLRAGNRSRISAVEDRMLRHMLDVATDPERTDNEDVRHLFNHVDPEHPALAEVSVFAEQDGIWRRWRFDKMLPAATLDLKSLGSWTGRPLEYEIGEVSARRRWEIQRADYHDGRLEAYRLIREGKVFGGTLAQHRYLEQIAAEHPTFGFVWLVYQKPDPSGRAAILMPVYDAQDSDMHEFGRAKLAAAKAFYLDRSTRLGFDKPWGRVDRMHFTDPEAKPAIRYPGWLGSDSPTEASAYASAETGSEADNG